MNKIVIESLKIGDVPVIIMAGQGAENLATVFFLHSFTSDKNQGLSLGYALSSKNMAMVSFDAPLHGERFDGRIVDVWSDKNWYIYPGASKLDGIFMMFQVIEGISADFSSLVRALEGDPRLDLSRLGLLGYSMGGFAAYHVITHSERVKAAVAIAASPSYLSKWQDQIDEAMKIEDAKEAIFKFKKETAQREDFIARLDPRAMVESFAPGPLLIINGDMDEKTPKRYSMELYESLSPLYDECPERLKIHLYSGVHHELKSEMITEAVDWFSAWL